MEELEDFLVKAIAVTIFVGIITVATIGFNYLRSYECRKTAELTEVEYKFHWASGCFYKEDGKWVKQNENNAEGTKVYVKGVK